MKISDHTGLSRDRVRRSTRSRANARIDLATRTNIENVRDQPAEALTRRIDELDREWDIERVLETNASSLALAGVVLGATIDRRWLLLSGTVLGFLLLHATRGWCPPLPLLRAAGVRTRGEIDEEKFALLEILNERIDATDPEELAAAARNPAAVALP